MYEFYVLVEELVACTSYVPIVCTSSVLVVCIY